MARRVLAARVRDPHLVDDLVQETVARVLEAWDSIEASSPVPYAITTARNLLASTWRARASDDRNQHRVLDLGPDERPDDAVVVAEAGGAVASAMAQLPPDDRRLLLRHDLEGHELAALADEHGTTAGALAARLKRTRARLRVEYLLSMDQRDPPSPACRPVLVALSGGDRRRQAELDVEGHLLGCPYCREVGEPLLSRADDGSGARVTVTRDADVVRARQAGRELAAQLGFGPGDGTLVATAISEVTRNIVKFAGTGEVRIERVEDGRRVGLQVVARDAGPGIADVELAASDGYSTYGGLGLGLPGCRRLMDDFDLRSQVGEGTTVTMRKWLRADTGAGGGDG